MLFVCIGLLRFAACGFGLLLVGGFDYWFAGFGLFVVWVWFGFLLDFFDLLVCWLCFVLLGSGWFLLFILVVACLCCLLCLFWILLLLLD